LLDALPENVTVAREHFTLDVEKSTRPRPMALSSRSGPVWTATGGRLLSPSPGAAVALARTKIPHYGSYSVLVIEEGKYDGQEVWPAQNSP